MKLHLAIVPGQNEMEMAAAIARSNIIVIAEFKVGLDLRN